MKRTAFLTAAIAILAALSPSFGQEREPQRGFRAGNSYSISDIENVNLNNGNLMLTIPLASLAPGRGTSPGYTVSLRYNGKLWDSRQERRTDGTYGETGDTNYMRELLQLSEQAGWKLDTGGFRLILKSRFNLEEQAQCTAGNGYEYRRNGYIFRLEMEMPDGSVKEFRPYGTGSAFDDEYDDGWFSIDPNGSRHVSSHIDYNGGGTSCSHDVVGITSSGMNYYTNDGSGLRLFVPAGQNVGAGIIGKNWTLYMPGGTTVENLPPDDPGIRQRMTDANGNRLVWKPGSYGGSNGEMIEDGAGHFVFITTDANGTQRVIQRGFGGADVETEIRWKTCWVYRNYKATSASNANGAYIYEDLFEPIAAVEKIILPGQAGGREYVFTYNAATVQPGSGNYTSGWGELKSVTLPSEARADYSFQLDGNAPVLSSFDVLNNPITRRDLVFAAEYDGGQTEVTESTVYSASATGGVGSVLRPDGSGTVEVSDTQGYFKGYAYKTLSSNGSMVERIWAQNPAPRVTGANSQPVNAYVKTELTTIADNSGNPVLTAIKDFDYDKNGNVLAVREYDWVPYLSVPRSGSGIYSKVTALPSGLVLKRKTVSEYYNQAPPASDTTTDSPYHYANPSAPRLRNLLKSSEVRDANDTTVSRTEFYYDDPNNKGNLTETRVWDSTKDDVTVPLSAANSVITSVQYNAFGAPTVTTDANGVQTAVTYGCIDGAASCSPNLENLYPTKIEKASNHSALKLTLAMRYDYFTGLPTLATDVDNGISTATYYDDLGRPVKVASAVGTDDEVWVQTEYDVVNRRVITRADVAAKGDGGKVAAQFFDQLGRVRLTKSLEDAATQSATNETDGIKVQTRYLTTNGFTYQLSSNPYRASVSSNAGSEESMGWTRSKAWSTGIRSEVETFAGSSLPAPWGSNTASTGVVRTDLDADRTLVTDQSGKQRISRTNGLGQLKEVWEIVPASDSSTVSVTFPGTAIAHGYRSAYNYDPLNNLTQVDQPLGATTNQVRSFTYSSLSRLLTAQNPESGTISYAYDPNGNLTSKKDARNITTAYSYDALNRVTQRTYDDNATLPVYYTYDNLSHAKGKLTKVTTGPVTSPFSVTEYTEFDAVGRVKKSKQTTDGTVYNEMEYKYNLSGAMVEAKYPSGRIVKTVLDDEGDLQTVKSQKNANNAFWNYANHFTYTAAGAVASMQLGNGTWEKTAFNSRLQPTQIGLGKVQNTTDLLQLDYTYGVVESSTLNTAKNNGNIQSQTITVPNITGSNGFTAVQTYSYDSLNRIDDATEMVTPAGSSTATQSWKQDYTFDRYGNRNFVEANTTTIPKYCANNSQVCPADRKVFNPSISASTNRINLEQDGDSVNDYAFDASGNTTKDANGRTFVYDAENKQIEVKNASNETIGQYWFDGDGRRVKKRGWINGQWETTVFVYDASSLLVAEYSTILNETPQVAYLTNDHLGSPRINTNENGAVVSRHDYRPYGEEITERRHSQYAADTVRKQFTSYERDGETGLDFAQARYFASGHGRFSSADSPFADQSVSDPQSWNLFVYVRNNPLNFTDPSGLFRWSNALGGTSTDKELADELNQLETEQFKNPKIDNSERITQLQGILGSRSRIVSAMNEALSSADSAFLSPQEQQALRDSIAAYGTPGVDNGVTVGMSLDTTTGGSTHTEGRQIIVALNLGDINAINLAHEGSHVVEASVYLANGTNPSLFATETRAYTTSALTALGMSRLREGRVLSLSYTARNGVSTELWGAQNLAAAGYNFPQAKGRIPANVTTYLANHGITNTGRGSRPAFPGGRPDWR